MINGVQIQKLLLITHKKLCYYILNVIHKRIDQVYYNHLLIHQVFSQVIYSLVFGYLKTSKNTGDSGENLTVIYDGYTIEIVSGLHLLKRVFGNAYDLYLENCEKYIKSQLKLDNKTSNNTQQDERTPSEILSSQVGLQSKDGLNHEQPSEHIINQPILGYNNPNNYHNNNPNNNYHNIN